MFLSFSFASVLFSVTPSASGPIQIFHPNFNISAPNVLIDHHLGNERYKLFSLVVVSAVLCR